MIQKTALRCRRVVNGRDLQLQSIGRNGQALFRCRQAIVIQAGRSGIASMEILLIAFVAFLVAGFVKGVVGFGFPIVSLIVLTLAFGLLDALAIILIPTFVTNAWQALYGPHLYEIARRMWKYFAVALLFVALTSNYLTVVNVNWLTALLGLVLVAFATLRLLDVRFRVDRRHETALSVVLGTVNGVITGLTGSFMVPSLMYMQAIGFSGDVLVQAMGVFFALSTLTLAFSLGSHGLVTVEQAGHSAIALIPSIAGLVAGRQARRSLDDASFQQVFLIAVLLLGAYILVRSVMTL